MSDPTRTTNSSDAPGYTASQKPPIGDGPDATTAFEGGNGGGGADGDVSGRTASEKPSIGDEPDAKAALENSSAA
jgi:hypothetical protein